MNTIRLTGICSARIFCLLIIIAAQAIGITAANAAKLQPSPAWVLEGLRTPESVLYHEDSKGNFLLVSEIDGDPAVADGNGGIAKVSIEGKMIDQDWVRGLNAPKGLAVHENQLYVADISEIVVIDIKSGKIKQKIAVAGATFLNDVVVDYRGVIYVSDTRTSKVYRITDKKVDIFLNDLEGANGLEIIGSNLVIGAGPSLWLANKQQSLFKMAEGFESNVDGIKMVSLGEFVVSCWEGLLYYVNADGSIEKILDARREKINMADLGFNSASRTLYVANFLKNSVTAYQLE